MHPALLRRSGRLQKTAQDVAPKPVCVRCFAGGDGQDGAELGARGKPDSLCCIQAAAHPQGVRAAGQGVGRLDGLGRIFKRAQRSLLRRSKPKPHRAGVLDGTALAAILCPVRQTEAPFYGSPLPRFAQAYRATQGGANGKGAAVSVVACGHGQRRSGSPFGNTGGKVTGGKTGETVIALGFEAI